MKKLLIFAVLITLFATESQAQDTTNTQNSYFLEFVKKVYFNPTVLLRTQKFRDDTKVRALILPDLNGGQDNHITGFEKAMQKIIRFLIEGGDQGSVRFYFDSKNTTKPFSFVCSDELWCKFPDSAKDSIEKRLNAPFQGTNFNLNSHVLFETAINGGLNYATTCLQNSGGECSEEPDNKTTEINTKPLSISLHNTNGSKFDIDTKQFNQLESHYAKATDLFTQQDWYAPAKAMLSGASSDEPMVLAINKHETLFKKENLKIKMLYNSSVLPVLASSTNDSIRFNLPKDLPKGNPIEVVVTYKSTVDSITYTVGFFMIQVMEKQTMKLNLLAANGFNVSDKKTQIENELKKIYDPVGITFEVAVKTWDPILDSEWPVNIQVESSGLLSNYPPDLRDWVNGVQDLVDYDKDEYYLVFGLSSGTLEGYMPRARNIGFIFSGAVDLSETVAHELGHGVFHLRHIFADEELGGEKKFQTRNVMDYKNVATNKLKDLYLHQWKFIDDPAFVSWFGGDDGEGSSVSINLTSEIFAKFGNPIDGSVTFLSPAGKPITLPKEVSEVRFSLPDDSWVVSIDGQSVPVQSPYTSVGSLIGFKIGGTNYNANVNHANTDFLGYENSNDKYYKEHLSKKLASYIPIVVTPVYTTTGFSVTISRTNLSKSSFQNIPDSNDASGVLNDMYSNFGFINKALLSDGITTGAVSFTTDFSTETIDVLNNLIFTEGPSEVNTSQNVVTGSTFIGNQFKFSGLDATTLYIAGANLESLSDYGTCLTQLDKLITSSAFQAIVSQNDKEYEKGFYERIDSDPLIKYSDRLKPKPIEKAQRVQFFDSEDQANFASLRFKMLFLSLREYNAFANVFITNQSQFETTINLESIDILLALYEAAEKIRSGMGDCLLEMISAPSKFEILKKSKEWTTSDSKEDILIKIIEHTSAEQFAELYPKLCENGYKVIRDLESDIWWSQYDELANALTLKMLAHHEYLGYEQDNLPVFKLYKDNLTPDAFDNFSSGKFNEDGILLKTELNGFNNNISIPNIKPDKLYKFIVKEDFTFPGYNGNIIKEGDTLIAPAYWAYYILNEEKESVNWYVARKTIEVILIVVTAGEALPAVIYIEAAFATSDFVISIARDYDPHNEDIREIQTVFNAVYMAYGIGALAKLGLSVNWVTQIAKGKQFVYKIYQNGFPNLLKELKSLSSTLSKQKIDDLITKLDDVILYLGNYVGSTISKNFLVQYFRNCKTLAKFSKYYNKSSYCKFVVKNDELSLVFTRDAHGITKGSVFKVANITDEADDIVLKNANLYLSTNDGEIILDDIIELSSIRVRQASGSVIEKEYRIVVTKQGKVRLISKANLQTIMYQSGAAATQLAGKLVSRGLTSSVADDIVIRVMYIDEALGGNKMISLLDELASSPNFTNSENILKSLNGCFKEGKVQTEKALSLMNEFNEGKYWIGRGEHVIVSKELTPGADPPNEVDVVFISGPNKGILECKRPATTGTNAENNVYANLELIIKKFRENGKLTQQWKDLYPKRFGQIEIANGSFPNLNSAEEFVNAVKAKGIIGNEAGVSKFTLDELKGLEELHILVNGKRIIIKPSDW